MKENNLFKKLSTRFLYVLFIFFLLFIISMGNKRYKSDIFNTNSTKSIVALNFVHKYNSKIESRKPILVNNISEVKMYVSTSSIAFNGELTGYGTDCEGCHSNVSCPPYPKIDEKNYTFADKEYGSVAILAADPIFPCGTIMKISDSKITNQPIYGIVLDRGSAVKGFIVDYLTINEAYSKKNIGRKKNVNFEIVRWSW